jgi:glycosyltransferase involved in cell wall biosynthesis
LVVGFNRGDAISNHALAIRSHLREQGYDSEIYALYIADEVKHEAKDIRGDANLGDAGLIYHHSTGSDATQTVVSHRGPKFLIYHNITPDYFFHGFDSLKSQELARGRSELAELVPYIQASAGDSEFNAKELKELGFANVTVIPFPVDPAAWSTAPSSTLMNNLRDGMANVLFVGRIAPHKKQCELVEAFSHLLDIDDRVRLILVGEFLTGDPYYEELVQNIARLQLESRVRLPGKISHADLNAYYRTGDLYWSMSEHEGFGVPLVEAMWFDVPVLAFKSSAIPETLGTGGIMFTSKTDVDQVAALARLMIRDTNLRERIVRGQRLQRDRFLPTNVWRKFDKVTETLWRASEESA